MSDHQKKQRVAVWAITPNGADLARVISRKLPAADLYLSAALKAADHSCSRFEKLSDTLPRVFKNYCGHICIMSTGIVIRILAPLLEHKTVDPAVVVVDEAGRHAISLLSGHIGGANRLAARVAGIIGAEPVITTATDVNRMPAIDVLAQDRDLFIENPEAVKRVNMAFLTGDTVQLHDPFGFLTDSLPNTCRFILPGERENSAANRSHADPEDFPGVYVDDVRVTLPPNILILRPASLVAGMGCNRNTAAAEMQDFLFNVLETFDLSFNSLRCIATIDIKADEPGLLALAEELALPLVFYDREELNRIETIETPSRTVEKHIGVKSVCEAAAILASNRGKLVVPKQSTRNVTVAVARRSFSS